MKLSNNNSKFNNSANCRYSTLQKMIPENLLPSEILSSKNNRLPAKIKLSQTNTRTDLNYFNFKLRFL